MRAASVALVLHSHLPYCRLAGRWPHGEEWFHEAMLECYLPLLGGFRRLARETPGSLGITLNVTPILAEQMGDPLMNEHFRDYLAGRIARAESDVARFDGQRREVASFHLDRYRASQRLYLDEVGGDVVGALAALEGSGHIELATCAATHGYLPLLGDERAVRFQVETGVASHIRNFGRRPRAFWLPECAYKPGIEEVLADAGIEVFFVETHLITGGQARGKALGDVVVPIHGESRVPTTHPMEMPVTDGTTFRAYHVGSSSVTVLGRNERSGKQVWSASHGYPGDPVYREFHKKDDESGLHYWRVTGDKVDLGEKAEYDPWLAAAVATDHAKHFQGVVRDELSAYRAGAGEDGIVMASYDTELFGHWWLEGVSWLEQVVRGLAADPAVELTTASRYVEKEPPAHSITLPEGSWGNGGDHRTWLNEDTAWTWPELETRGRRAAALFASDTRASRQLARELLLMQSSDWQFLMTTGQARDYAIERFRSHMERFDSLAGAMAGGDGLDALLAEYEALDNPFADIDPRVFVHEKAQARG